MFIFLLCILLLLYIQYFSFFFSGHYFDPEEGSSQCCKVPTVCRVVICRIYFLWLAYSGALSYEGISKFVYIFYVVSILDFIRKHSLTSVHSGFGGLGVACCLLVPKCAGSDPAEAIRIFQGEEILSTPSFGGEVKPSVPCRRFAACKRSLNGVEVAN